MLLHHLKILNYRTHLSLPNLRNHSIYCLPPISGVIHSIHLGHYNNLWNLVKDFSWSPRDKYTFCRTVITPWCPLQGEPFPSPAVGGIRTEGQDEPLLRGTKKASIFLRTKSFPSTLRSKDEDCVQKQNQILSQTEVCGYIKQTLTPCFPFRVNPLSWVHNLSLIRSG